MATCGMRAWMSWRQRSISVADGCSWLKVYRTDGRVATAEGAEPARTTGWEAVHSEDSEEVFAFMVCLGNMNVGARLRPDCRFLQPLSGRGNERTYALARGECVRPVRIQGPGGAWGSPL